MPSIDPDAAGGAAQVVSIERLRREATNRSRSLYRNNETVNEILRYGVSAKTE
jgi:hypothetical protein